jgi:hypothetical protein
VFDSIPLHRGEHRRPAALGCPARRRPTAGHLGEHVPAWRIQPACEALSDCCDGGLVEKTPLQSPIGEHLRSGDGRTLLLLATHFGVHGRRAASRGFIQRFMYGVDVMEEQAWPWQLQEARRYPNALPLILDPRIVEAHSLDLSRLQLHYLRAREYFVNRLQNAQLAMSLGAE